jgi:hypothetical protein
LRGGGVFAAVRVQAPDHHCDLVGCFLLASRALVREAAKWHSFRDAAAQRSFAICDVVRRF